MEQHFVQFMSPGTFVPETTEKQIDSWDIEAAKKMAASITERHNAKPFGFRFITRLRGGNDLDSHVSAQSGTYYLGGRVETRAEVEARNDPKEEILRSNMRRNNIERIIINDNSWRFTAALNDGDTVLQWP